MSKLLHKELARRLKAGEAEKPSLDLSKHLFDKQFAFVSDPARFKTAVCSRRSGKSEACVADLIDTALKNPLTNCAYITLARTSAKRIIWPMIKRVLKDYEINAKYDNSELAVELENGSSIYVGGAKDLGEVDKYRGMSFKKVYIDEAQSFRQSILEELIDRALAPALWDVGGTLCLIGTPGPVPAGLFFSNSHNPAWSNHKWTILDNPWIEKKSGITPQALLAQERARKGITEADPSYRREALGEWLPDLNSLVFKFNPLLNVVVEAPKDLTYIFGIDLGFNDADAIAVLGYNYKDQCVYLVEEVVTRKQGITELVHQIEFLRKKYNPVKMVMDAGALGKKIQSEIQIRHSIPLEAADKVRKHEYIELLNDDLRTGKFKAVQKTQFEEDCSLVVWDREDPSKLRISDRYHSDSCFVAGTKIDTKDGKKNIEDIKAGDLILTRLGYFPAKWAEKTGIDKVIYKLSFSDGSVLSCTGNHPIYTLNRGFVPANKLHSADQCVSIRVWELIKDLEYTERLSFFREQSFIDTPSLSGRTYETTIADTIKKKDVFFIEPFGHTPTDQYQKAGLSTIKTKIPLITNYLTSNVLLQSSILENINIENSLKPIGNICTKSENWRQSGMAVQKAFNGIESTPSIGEKKIGRRLSEFAQFANQNICAINYQRGTEIYARQNASLETEEIVELTTLSDNAASATLTSQQINIQSRNFVVGLVTREILTKKEDVFNISVSEIPEYFANGILVHNCDAVLYAWRECKHFIPKSIEKVYAKNSKEYMDQLEEKEAEKLMAKLSGNDEEEFGITDDDLEYVMGGDNDDF